MKKNILTILIFYFAFFLFVPVAFSQSPVGFSQEDRERIIRLDERLSAQQKEINTRFEAMDDKFDKLYNLMYFILAGLFGLIGLIFWDRRSYIKPVKEDINEILKAPLNPPPAGGGTLTSLLPLRGIWGWLVLPLWGELEGAVMLKNSLNWLKSYVPIT